jgi:hypothetical protein
MIESRKDYLFYLQRDRLARLGFDIPCNVHQGRTYFPRSADWRQCVHRAGGKDIWPEPNISIAGVPAGKISDKGSEGLMASL